MRDEVGENVSYIGFLKLAGRKTCEYFLTHFNTTIEDHTFSRLENFVFSTKHRGISESIQDCGMVQRTGPVSVADVASLGLHFWRRKFIQRAERVSPAGNVC